MTSFITYSEALKKEIAFTFGRFNVPTVGHQKLLDKVASTSKEYRIYASQSQDPKKNPLDYKTKIKYMREMFPRHAKNIIEDKAVRNALDVLFKLYDEGYTDVNFVVGSDRVKSFEFLKKYNGVEAKGKYYKFDTINIVSAGERDPDSDDAVAAMSASKLRKAAAEGDFKTFESGMPKGFSNWQRLFNDTRKGMGLDPFKTFREHYRLPSVSDIREQYVKGKVLQEGSTFEYEGETLTVKECKPNFVITECGKKVFVSDVKL